MSLQDNFHGGSCDAQRGIVQGALLEQRRETGGHQQRVAFAERELEPFSQKKYHVTRRLRSPTLEKTQMSLRYLGFAREIELAQPPLLAPVTDKRADRLLSGEVGGGGNLSHELRIDLKKVPLREPDITPEEILLSESLERRILAFIHGRD